MKKYFKPNLVVITKRTEYAEQFKTFDDFFKVSVIPKCPSIINILFSTETLYVVDPDLKRSHKIAYAVIKLLHKRLTKKHNLVTIFITDRITKPLIFLPHNYLSLSMYLYHIPSEVLARIAILCTDTNKQDLESDPQLDKTLISISKKLKNGTYLPDPQFRGNIFITNTLSTKLIDLLMQKFPNLSSINIKQLDTLVEVPKEKTLIQDLTNHGSDSIKTYAQIQKLKEKHILLSSYCRTESEFLKLNFEPNVVNFRKLQENQSLNKTKYSLFFAGNARGSRFNKILSIINITSLTPLSALFILTNLTTAEKQKILSLNLPDRISLKFSGVSYDKFIQLEQQSTILIELYRKTPDEGYSYRISECLALNKKLLTDRDLIYGEPFYDKKMILISKDLNIKPSELVEFSKQENIKYRHVDAYNIANSFICTST